MRARPTFIVLSIAASLAGCAPPSGAARAAVNGEIDVDERYPGVMGMFINKPEGIARCTGVLIERNLLLTARHCIAPTNATLVCGVSPLGTPVSGPNILATTDVTVSTDDTSRYVAARRVLVPPDGNDECGYDLAAVILDGEVAATPFAPRLDTPVTTGEVFTAVGYGSTGSGGLGTRRARDEMHVACVGGADCTDATVQPTEWMGESGGFCQSDSGSPSLDPSGRVIGIVSKGVNPCETPISSSLYAFASFVRSAGLEAAIEGGYDPPSWATTIAADGGTSDAGPPAAVGSCATHPSRVNASPSIAFALLMLTLVRARRRRARGSWSTTSGTTLL